MTRSAEKFLQKYRVPSVRACWRNYDNAGLYFFTICTIRHEQIFGKIKNRKMQLSPIGRIVRQEWNKSFQIRNELFCDNVVIMPNHIQAVLRIENRLNLVSTCGTFVAETHGRASLRMHDQSTEKLCIQPPAKYNKYGFAFGPSKPILSFVAGFKSAATKRINEFQNTPKMPVWQSRYHDHSIRNAMPCRNIYSYIQNNPANWNTDQFLKRD